MNDQTIRELDEAIRLNPEDAAGYINRGYAYYKKGDNDKAIEDFDNAVRFCPNYETDFIDSNFAHGEIEAVEAAIELLNNVIGSSCESAADFYYAGVRALLGNNKITAQRAFKVALELGHEDLTKVERHLENLEIQK